MESLKEAGGVKDALDFALRLALDSPCRQSKRGVVIVRRLERLSLGVNRPPMGFACAPSACYDPPGLDICRYFTLHAEEVAIVDALKRGVSLEGSRLYHVRVKEGVRSPTGGPSCTRCSALILDSGITEVVLDQREGISLYGAREFHELSLATLRT